MLQGFGILNGKQYVYMSKATMRLGDFCTHLKKAYPLSALVDSSANTEKLKTSSGRHFQVCIFDWRIGQLLDRCHHVFDLPEYNSEDCLYKLITGDEPNCRP